MGKRDTSKRGQVFKMRQLREVIAIASGVRIVEDIGTPYTTGQTVAKVWLFIDLSNIIQRTIDTTSRRYGSKRTERFVQWCNGRQVNTYWREHRPTLYQDIERLKSTLETYESTV